ncbi:hypothetical protein ACHWQZ_G008239 [Mnemiopsis leidyi]
MGNNVTFLHTRQCPETVKVKYAYIKMQGEGREPTSDAQQHVETSKQLHVQKDNSEWVYLIVSPWSEEQFIAVPPSPARYSKQQQGAQFIKVQTSTAQYFVQEQGEKGRGIA